MPFPFVSRLAFDVMRERTESAEQRYDALLSQYHALKVQGAVAPKGTIPAPVPPPLDPEQRLLEQAERAFVDNAAAEFQRMGKSQDEARRIADQIRQAVNSTDTPVPFGL